LVDVAHFIKSFPRETFDLGHVKQGFECLAISIGNILINK